MEPTKFEIKVGSFNYKASWTTRRERMINFFKSFSTKSINFMGISLMTKER
jgi:hypothetical protein